jgi:hypothetical protein
MKNLVRTGLVGLVLLFTAAAQDGHYEGTLSTPGGDMKMAVDIAKNSGGAWTGSMAMNPGPSGILLESISVNGDQVGWTLNIPGQPKFAGTWSKEASTIKGKLSAPNGNEVPVELKRTAEAKVDLPPPSTPVATEIQGKWVGAITAPNGQTLRLEIDLANAGGKGGALVTSVDQNNVKIPANSFTQTGKDIAMELRGVGAKITGKVNADNTAIDATVNQGGADMPLKLTRPAPAAGAAPTVK